MEQSPSSEGNSSSAGKEIPHFLWNMKIHYCVLTTACYLSQLNPFPSGY